MVWLYSAWIAASACGTAPAAGATPLIPAGNAALRADIQLLADYGVIRGPVTTWPLAWGPILADIEDSGSTVARPPQVLHAAARVRGILLPRG